jgi:spore germination protein GerM
MDPMAHKRAILWLLLAGAAVIGGVLIFGDRIGEETPQPVEPEGRTLTTLYFADPREACLRAEERTLTHGAHPADLGTSLMKALADGPEGELSPTLPPSATVGEVTIRKGVAYVDLDAATVARLPGGSESELLTIYSIVNTLCLNIPEVAAAKILVEGESAATLKGHMDLRFAFKPDRKLIR